MIVLSFEKKTEQLNSKFCHRCLQHSSSLLRTGQFEHGWVICIEEMVPRRDFSIAWILILQCPFYAFEDILEEIKLIQHCKTTCCYRATLPSTSTTLEAPTTCTPSIPGGKDIKKWRQTVFFTAVNPMHTHLHKQRNYDVTKPRVAVYKQNWKRHQKTVYWCNLRVAQKKGLTFYQTRSNAIILHNTVPAPCIEKVVAMSSGEVLKNKMCESPRSLRKVVQKPAWHEGRTDTTSIEERASNADSIKYGETCRGEIVFRIQGLPHSTVEQEDHTRKEVVKKLFHQFETHPNREALKADLRQKSSA